MAKRPIACAPRYLAGTQVLPKPALRSRLPNDIVAGLLYFVGQWIVLDLTFLAGLRYMVRIGDMEFVFAHGSWLQIQHTRVDYYLIWLGRYGLGSYVTILASFPLGLWAVKSGYLRRVIETPASTRCLLVGDRSRHRLLRPLAAAGRIG